MSPQAESEVRDDGRVWVLDARAILFHNRHIKGGTGFVKGCQLCSGLLEKTFGVHEIEVPSRRVRESSGTDETETAASTPGPTPWERYVNSGVREQGEV